MNSGEQKRRKRARHKPGLQASTLPEVRKGVREALIYIEDSLKIKGEKWEQGHLIESWIADVLTVGRQEQLRRALRGQAIVEALRLREERNEPPTRWPMKTDELGGRGMKTRRQKGAEAPGREQARANLRLDAEAYRRLLVASVMEGRPAGEIVSRLIEDHLRRWSMPGDLSARARSSDRQAGDDRVIESVPVAA